MPDFINYAEIQYMTLYSELIPSIRGYNLQYNIIMMSHQYHHIILTIMRSPPYTVSWKSKQVSHTIQSNHVIRWIVVSGTTVQYCILLLALFLPLDFKQDVQLWHCIVTPDFIYHASSTWTKFSHKNNLTNIVHHQSLRVLWHNYRINIYWLSPWLSHLVSHFQSSIRPHSLYSYCWRYPIFQWR